MLPEGCIMLPEGRRLEGSILQPKGSIMWHVGGIFSGGGILTLLHGRADILPYAALQG